jgi:hypothetical protein
MVIQERKKSKLWALCLVAVVITLGTVAVAQIVPLLRLPTPVKSVGLSRPVLIAPARPPVVSPIHP